MLVKHMLLDEAQERGIDRVVFLCISHYYKALLKRKQLDTNSGDIATSPRH